MPLRMLKESLRIPKSRIPETTSQRIELVVRTADSILLRNHSLDLGTPAFFRESDGLPSYST